MKKYTGIPSAGGVAYATSITVPSVLEASAIKNLDQAVAACIAQIQALYEKTLRELGKNNAEIFSVYEEILRDEYFLQPIRERSNNGMELSLAVETTAEEMAAVFSRAKSKYMQQRAEDIQNISSMLIRKIKGIDTSIVFPEGSEKVIVLAESLSPTDTMSMDKTRLAGFATRYGGATSHVVILAKALGIPAITGLEELREIPSGIPVAIDGNTGELIASPDAATLEIISDRIREQENHRAMLSQLPQGEVRTKDGTLVHVSINIGSSSDLENIDLTSLYGVGLFRTEFLFVERNTAPTLEEQITAYKRVFDLLDGKDLIIRTLDIGGDKNVPYLNLPKEENPFLGCRGIRLCFAHEDLLRTQFLALMKASHGRPFSVMFPMINSVDEFLKAKQIWNEVRETLTEPISEEVQLGVMIETPSAMLCADMLAQHVDFASIGTNDLTQYLLAADRGNPDVGILQSHYSPAVLRSIRHIIHTFRAAGVKISLCGEAGSDLNYLPVLIGMGLQYVSVSPSVVDPVRYCILQTNRPLQQERMQLLLNMQTEQDIRLFLQNV